MRENRISVQLDQIFYELQKYVLAFEFIFYDLTKQFLNKHLFQTVIFAKKKKSDSTSEIDFVLIVLTYST